MILESFERLFNSKFHAKIDDTVMNRICTAIVCKDPSHSQLWSSIPIQFVQNIESRQSDLLSRLKELDSDQKDLIEVLFCLSYHFACTSEHSIRLDRLISQMLRSQDEDLPIVLIQSLIVCLKSTRNLKDLTVLECLIDDKMIQNLYAFYQSQQNIHLSKDLLFIFGHILVIGLYSHKLDRNSIISLECIKWTQTGQSIFLLAMELIGKYGISCPTSNTLLLDLKITVEKFQSLDLPKQARLLFLLCKHPDLTQFNISEWIDYLKSIDNLPKLCTSTLDIILRSPVKLIGELSDFIVSFWCDKLMSSLEHIETNNSTLDLISLRTQCTEMDNLHFQLPIKPNLVATLFDRFSQNKDTDSCFCHGKRCSCELRLWSLLNILTVAGPEFQSLAEHCGRICVLFKQFVDRGKGMDFRKFSRLLDYVVLVCQKHWLSKRSDVTNFLFKLLDNVTDQILDLTTLSTVMFAFLRLFKQLNDMETDQGFISKHVFYLLGILVNVCTSHFIGNDFSDNTEQQLQLGKMILRYLNLECSHHYWTTQSQAQFRKFLKAVLPSDRDVDDNFSLSTIDADFHLLILSTMVIYLISSTEDGDSLANECSFKWLKESFINVLTFDFSESSEYFLIVRLISNNLKLLEKKRLTQENKHLDDILCMLHDKLPHNLEESVSNQYPNRYDDKCPTCRESIGELLDDILIARTNDMIVDCSEG